MDLICNPAQSAEGEPAGELEAVGLQRWLHFVGGLDSEHLGILTGCEDL